MFQVFKRAVIVRDNDRDELHLFLSNKKYCFDDDFSDLCDMGHSQFHFTGAALVGEKVVINGPLRVGAGVLPFVNEEYIVMPLRPRDEKIYPGKVSVFGGHVNYGESVLHTAFRELSEELTFLLVKRGEKTFAAYSPDPLREEVIDYSKRISSIAKPPMVRVVVRGTRGDITEEFFACVTYTPSRGVFDIVVPVNIDFHDYDMFMPIYSERGDELALVVPVDIFPKTNRRYYTTFTYNTIHGILTGNANRVFVNIF